MLIMKTSVMILMMMMMLLLFKLKLKGLNFKLKLKKGEEKKMELWVIGQSDTHSLQAKNKKVIMVIFFTSSLTHFGHTR